MSEEKKMNMEAEKVGKLLDVVSEKAPKIIKNLIQTLYSEEAGRDLGKGVGALYKELINAGMDKKDAVEMTKDYLNSIKEMAPKNMGQGNNGPGSGFPFKADDKPEESTKNNEDN